jgi:hypothetical protein
MILLLESRLTLTEKLAFLDAGSEKLVGRDAGMPVPVLVTV